VELVYLRTFSGRMATVTGRLAGPSIILWRLQWPMTRQIQLLSCCTWGCSSTMLARRWASTISIQFASHWVNL
jgi:hypothetical protein